jgi:hypothetical protein
MATDSAHSEPTEEFANPDSVGSAEMEADLDVDADHAGSVRGGVTPGPAGPTGIEAAPSKFVSGKDVHSSTS